MDICHFVCPFIVQWGSSIWIVFTLWLLWMCCYKHRRMCYPFELPFCLDICPGVGFLDHMAILFLVFWGNSILFSIVAALTYISTNRVGGFPFLDECWIREREEEEWSWPDESEPQLAAAWLPLDVLRARETICVVSCNVIGCQRMYVSHSVMSNSLRPHGL